MLFFCITDLKYFHISNWVVLPAIALGVYLTGNWFPALVMFGIGALLFQGGDLAGGDVKLMAMTGAFTGVWALPAFILSRIFVYLYRIVKKETRVLPYAPFFTLASIPFLWIR